MANGNYAFKLCNGREIIVNDGTIDTSQTPIDIPGRASFNWMIAINESMLHINESFYNITQPRNPMQGQLYYKQPPDSQSSSNYNDETLQVCVQSKSDTSWRDSADKYKYIMTMYKETSQPDRSSKWQYAPHLSFGDIWFDTKKNQINFYTPDGWVNIKDENSVFDAYKYISEDRDNAIIYIVNKNIFTEKLAMIPALSFGDEKVQVNNIAKSDNPDNVSDFAIPTSKWVNDKVKTNSGGIETVFINADTTISVRNYDPSSPKYVAGKVLCFKNVTDKVINIKCDGLVIDGSMSSIRMTRKMSIQLASYYAPAVGYSWYLI